MSGAPDNLPVVERWMAKADNDLRNAEHTLLLQDDCPFDTICFHSQQCVEKCLKALLIWRGEDPPRTHDIRLLTQRLPAEFAPRFDLARLLILNRYSIEARYPGDWETIGRADASEAVELARNVRDIARALLAPVTSDTASRTPPPRSPTRTATRAASSGPGRGGGRSGPLGPEPE